MWKKVLSIGLLILVVLSAGCVGEGTGETGTSQENVIKIGVVADLSGPLSYTGVSVKNNLEIAKEDINNYFKKEGLPYQVELYVEDTRTDPKIALEKIQTLKSKGVNVIIGPTSSGEVKNIRSFTESNKIIAISPSSTAAPPLIGVTSPNQKKYLFRFVASDDLQGQAIAGEVSSLNLKHVVIIYRGDAWGKGLSNKIKKNLPDAGVTLEESIEYPSNPSPSDWSPYLSKVESEVKTLSDQYGKENVGVIAVGFKELATMFSQIPDDSFLWEVKWVGSDGTVKSDKLEELKDRLSRVGFWSTIFESFGPDAEKVKEKYAQKFGGSPDAYGLISYDALWVASLAQAEVIQENGKYDPDLMVVKMKEVIDKYNKGEYGQKPVTGDITLNKFNDRASGDYAIYKVTKNGWEKVGVWKFDTKTVEWIENP